MLQTGFNGRVSVPTEKRFLIHLLSVSLGLVLLTGCTNLHSVHVTSNPSGARVYNACGVSECGSTFRGFRPYDHVQGTYRGETPVSYGRGMYNYDNVRVVWPDGEDSGWTSQMDPSSWPKDFTFSFVKRNVVPPPVLPLRQNEAKPPIPPPVRTQQPKDITPSQPSKSGPSKRIALPDRSWESENIAVADLITYTLSQGEAKTLTEKLYTTLAQTGYFNILSRSDMKTVLETQQFQMADVFDDSSRLAEMGKILAVQKIVGGSIGKVGSTYILAVRLVDVETGKTEITSDRKIKAESDELLDLMEEVGRALALTYAKSKAKKTE